MCFQPQAACCQGDVGSDADVILADVLGDPVIGGIFTLTDRDAADANIVARSLDVGIADDDHIQSAASRNPVHFLFDRASVRIYIDIEHLRQSPFRCLLAIKD